jgi:hypothetical protein
MNEKNKEKKEVKEMINQTHDLYEKIDNNFLKLDRELVYMTLLFKQNI